MELITFFNCAYYQAIDLLLDVLLQNAENGGGKRMNEEKRR